MPLNFMKELPCAVQSCVFFSERVINVWNQLRLSLLISFQLAIVVYAKCLMRESISFFLHFYSMILGIQFCVLLALLGNF